MAHLADVDGIQLAPGASAIAEMVGSSDHLVFVLADGLGMHQVEAMDGCAFIPGHLAAEVCAVFPSTTPVALTSLATGEWPNVHGAIGWNVYLPEIHVVAEIIRFFRRRDQVSLDRLGLTPEDVYPVPSAFSRTDRDVVSFLPEAIAGSPYSVYAVGGAPNRGYRTLSQAVDAVLQRVATADGPTFTNLYWPNVDTVSHALGTEHAHVRAAVRELDREIARLHAGLSRRGRIVLSADHGLVDTAEDQVHVLEPSDELIGCLTKEPSGEDRAVYFSVAVEKEARFRDLFKRRFGERFLLLATDEVQALELFGPGLLSVVARRRLGNLVAISTGADVLLFPWTGPPSKDPPAVSRHSGLNPAEIRVPLMLA